MSPYKRFWGTPGVSQNVKTAENLQDSLRIDRILALVPSQTLCFAGKRKIWAAFPCRQVDGLSFFSTDGNGQGTTNGHGWYIPVHKQGMGQSLKYCKVTAKMAAHWYCVA